MNIELRDYFAAKALLLCEVDESNMHGAAKFAYEMADAMLAARGQEKTNQCGETCERAKLCATCAKGLQETHDGWIEEALAKWNTRANWK